MKKPIFSIIFILFLAGCATQLVEISINKGRNGEVENVIVSPTKTKPVIDNSVETKQIANKLESLVSDSVKAEIIEEHLKANPHKENNNEYVCPKFKLPKVILLPPLPKEILSGKELNDKVLIELLTEHVVVLRKNASINRGILINSYNAYADSCKK